MISNDIPRALPRDQRVALAGSTLDNKPLESESIVLWRGSGIRSLDNVNQRLNEIGISQKFGYKKKTKKKG